MIEEAKDAGADLVKFQLYDAEDDKDKPHYKFSKQSELSFDQAKMLFDYGKEVGIEVFFSVFGVKYVEWCETIGVRRYKIACWNHNSDLMRAIWATNKPLIISETSPSLGRDYDSLYCVSKYPASRKDIKLPDFLGDYDGFSDHTIGIDVAKVALARGAKIIEKHFCLEKDCPEGEWSMTPCELKELKKWENVCKEVL